MELDSPALLNAVQALASHAVPAFGGALLLLLCAVWGLWRLGQRYGVYRAGSRLGSLAQLVAYLLLGFGLVTGAAALFAEIAENLVDGKKLGQLDQLFSDTLQSTLPDGTVRVFAWLTHMGDPVTLIGLSLVVLLTLLWQRRYWLCAGWLLATGGNAMLNPVLKSIFKGARPLHESAQAIASGWSFPSGHASSSVVVYGMLAYVMVRGLPAPYTDVRLPVVLLATALAFSVGCSRVFIRVHFASDVLAGFASGMAWLTVCIVAIELARYRQRTA